MEVILGFLGFDLKGIEKIESWSLISNTWDNYGYLYFLLFSAIAFYLGWEYHRLKKIPQKVKYALFSLRIIALLLLFFALLNIQMHVIGSVIEKNKLVFLVDKSKSMSIPYKNSNRWDFFRETIAAKKSFIFDLKKRFNFFGFSFASSLQEVELLNLKSKPGFGNETDIIGNIQSVIETVGQDKLAAILLYTDGNHTKKESSLAGLDTQGVPVHFFTVSKDNTARDIILHEIKAPEIGYLNNRFPFEVKISQEGFQGKKLIVVLKQGNKILKTESVTVNGNELHLKWSIDLKKEGNFKYNVEIPVQKEELFADNNKQSFIVKVVKEKIEILQLSGLPGYEANFMENILREDPAVNIKSLTLLSGFGGKNSRLRRGESPFFLFKDAKLKEKKRRVAGKDFAQLLKNSDLLILSSWNNILSNFYVKVILDYIKKNKMAILFLPGRNAVSKTDPLLTILPFASSFGTDRERHHFSVMLPGVNLPFLDSLTSSSQKHFWESLPAFEYLHKTGSHRTGSQVLAVSNRNKKAAIIYHNYGKSKVLALLSGPTWKWRFRLVGNNRNALVFPRFWGSLIRFMVEREHEDEGKLEITPRQVQLGKRVNLALVIKDPATLKLAASGLFARIITPDNREDTVRFIRKNREKNRFEASYIPSEPGKYNIRLYVNNSEMKSSRDDFFYAVQPTREFVTMKMNFELMGTIARSTGGSVLPLAKIESLRNIIKEKRVNVEKSIVLDAWNNIFFFLLFIFCLCFEWYYKRKYI
ncbi:hypothetical protein ACFL35_00850 [Candidatus Riflebacteria bacterium]